MTTAPVYPGQRILVEGKFRLYGVPTDPTVVRCLTIDPDGALTILTYPAETLTRRDLGFFEASFTIDKPGTWQFRVEGSGIVDAVNETVLQVSSTNFL